MGFRNRTYALLIAALAAVVPNFACSSQQRGMGDTGSIRCSVQGDATKRIHLEVKDGEAYVTNYWDGGVARLGSNPNKPYSKQYLKPGKLEEGQDIIFEDQTGASSVLIYTDDKGVYVQATDEQINGEPQTILAFVQDGDIGVDLSGTSTGAAQPFVNEVGKYPFINSGSDDNLPKGFERFREDFHDVIVSNTEPNDSSLIIRTDIPTNHPTTCTVDFGRAFNR